MLGPSVPDQSSPGALHPSNLVVGPLRGPDQQLTQKVTKSPDEFDASSEESFLRQQVLSSSNVGGPLLCWFNGGLNYQIEHHLFPRIHHSHYPKIAPIVREFCRERDISYTHFHSIYENLVSTSRYLYQIGHLRS